jgi:hypothetical protein
LLFWGPGSQIRDPGWVKIRIQDKHPGSATLYFSILEPGSHGQGRKDPWLASSSIFNQKNWQKNI